VNFGGWVERLFFGVEWWGGLVGVVTMLFCRGDLRKTRISLSPARREGAKTKACVSPGLCVGVFAWVAPGCGVCALGEGGPGLASGLRVFAFRGVM